MKKKTTKRTSLPTDIYKAMSDPYRYYIMSRLSKEKVVSVSSVLEHLKICPTLLSHHFKTLKVLNIAVSSRKGKRVFYTLAKGVKSGKGLTLNGEFVRSM